MAINKSIEDNDYGTYGPMQRATKDSFIPRKKLNRRIEKEERKDKTKYVPNTINVDGNIKAPSYKINNKQDTVPRANISVSQNKPLTYNPISIKEAPEKPTETERKPASSNSEFSLSDMLLGATPALVGLLTGARKAGFNQSANLYGNIFKMRQKEIEDANKIRLARAKKTGGMDEWKAKEDYKSKLIMDRNKKLGRTMKKVKDAQGNIKWVDKSLVDNEQLVGKQDTFEDEPLPPSWIKEADKADQAWYRNNKQDLATAKDAQKALELMATGRAMPTRIAQNMAVKITEQRATDQDRAFVNNAIGYVNRIQEWADENTNGVIPERLRKDMQVVFDTLSKVTNKYMYEAADEIAAARAGSRKNRKYRYLLGRLGANIPSRGKIDKARAMEIMNSKNNLISNAVNNTKDFLLKGKKVKVSDGNKTYIIDPSDVEEAMKDGFKVIQ